MKTVLQSIFKRCASGKVLGKIVCLPCLMLFMLLSAQISNAQNNTWTGNFSANWNTNGNWSLGIVPTAAHNVIIPNGVTATITVNTAAVCNTLTMNGGSLANTVSISGTNSLTVTGAVSIGAGTGSADNKILAVGNGTLTCASISITATTNSNRTSEVTLSTGTVNVTGNISMGDANNNVRFTGAGNLNIGGNISGGNLIPSTGRVTYNGSSAQVISGANTSAFFNLVINKPVSTGTVSNNGNAFVVGNDLTITNGELIINATNANAVITRDILIQPGGNLTHSVDWASQSRSLNIGRHWTNNGSFSAGTGRVFFNGAVSQQLSGSSVTSFFGLTLDNINGLTLSSVDASISGSAAALNLVNGRIITGVQKLILGNNATITGASATRYVQGNLEMGVDAGTQMKGFEVGDAIAYLPVQITCNNVTQAGSVLVNTNNAEHPSIVISDIDESRNVNKYWTIVNNAVVLTDFDAVFGFPSTTIDAAADPLNFIVGNFDGSWSYPTVSSTSANSTGVSGVANFGDFVVGEGGAGSPIPQTQPADETTCNNGTVSFTAAAISRPVSTVQWQVSTNGGVTFNPITIVSPYSVSTTHAGSVTTSILTINPATNSLNSYLYRPVFTNSRGNVVLNAGELTVTPSPSALAGSNQSVCAGGTVTLNGSIGGSASSATWSAATGLFSDASVLNSTYTPSISTGSIVLTLTTDDPDGAGSCVPATSNVTITVQPQPTVSNAGSPQTICSTGTATLSANLPSVGSGSWLVESGPSTSNAQFSSITNRNAVFTPAGGIGTYILRWTISSAGCPSSTSTVTITVVAAATTANAGANRSICRTSPATLAANTPSNGTGTWTIVSGPNTNISQISNVNLPNAVFSPTAAGTYQLRWTISNGTCSNFSNVTFTVSNPPSNPNISFNQVAQQSNQTIVICGPIGGGGQNDVDIYNYTPPSGSTYQWQYSTNGGPWTIAGVPSNTTQYVVSSFAGTIGTHQFQMIMTTPAGCVVSSNIITLTVNPVSTLGGTSVNACSGTAFSSTITGFPSGTSFSWTAPSVTGGMTGGSSGSGSTLTGTLTNNSGSVQTATYTVTPVYSSGSNPPCTVTFPVVVTVNPRPNINPAASAVSVCTSTTSQVTTLSYSGLTFLPTTYSITWNSTPTNSFAAVTNAALPASPINITVPANAAAGTYTGNITVRNANGCVSTSKSFTVTVFGSPTINNSTTAAALCYSSSDQNTTLTYSSSTNSPTTYSITWNPVPANNFATITDASLPASPINITVPGGTNPGTYTGYLVAKNNNGCSTAIKTFTLLVRPLPTAAWSLNAVPVCRSTNTQNTSLAYSTTTGSPNRYNIVWDPIPANSFTNVSTVSFTGSVSGGTINIVVPPNTPAGTYTGNITVRDANLCTSAPPNVFSITVNEAPLLPGTISGVTEVCEGSIGLDYEVSPVSGANSYNWTLPVGWSVNSGAGTSGITVNAGNGSLSGNITVTATNTCGTSPVRTLPVIVNTKGTWLGFTSDWNDGGNWCGGIPSASTDVLIPSGTPNDPVISTSVASVRNINIVPGAQVTLTNQLLTIAGTITATGNLDARNGTIELNGNAALQNMAGSYFTANTIKKLVISNSNGVAFTGLNDSVKISELLKFGTSNANLNTNNNLVLLSNASGTASVGDMTANGLYSGNTITGNATVERFVPQHSKAWQFLSAPTSGQTINQAWQEGNAPLANSRPGYGTIITGNMANATALGFDIATPVASGPGVKTFNPATGLWEAVPSTNTAIANSKGYMLFVRGDRSVNAFNQPETATTLRTTGKLYTTGPDAPPVINVGADQFASIGNPYASAIDFTKLNKSASIQDVFYLWDPKLTTGPNSAYGLGGYQALVGDGTSYTAIPGGGSFAGGNTNIESGMAFFVRATGTNGTVSFSETSKVEGSHTVTRQSPRSYQQIRVNLSVVSGGTSVLLDGALSQYDESWSNSVDIMDALKMGNNGGENISISRENKLLVAERRTKINRADTIFYQLGQLKRQQYQFEFDAANLGVTGMTAFLQDTYLGTTIPLNTDGTTLIPFVVDAQPGSSAPNRFRIIFRQLRPVPVDFAGIKAIRVEGKRDILVQWSVENEINISQYELEHSTDGRSFHFLGRINAIGEGQGKLAYDFTHVRPAETDHFYRVRSIGDGESRMSPIVKLSNNATAPGIQVYPNPVTDNRINIYLTGQKAGNYIIRLFNASGQTILNKTIKLTGLSSVETINPAQKLPAGVYNLSVISGEEAVHKQHIIIQ